VSRAASRAVRPMAEPPSAAFAGHMRDWMPVGRSDAASIDTALADYRAHFDRLIVDMRAGSASDSAEMLLQQASRAATHLQPVGQAAKAWSGHTVDRASTSSKHHDHTTLVLCAYDLPDLGVARSGLVVTTLIEALSTCPAPVALLMDKRSIAVLALSASRVSRAASSRLMVYVCAAAELLPPSCSAGIESRLAVGCALIEHLRFGGTSSVVGFDLTAMPPEELPDGWNWRYVGIFGDEYGAIATQSVRPLKRREGVVLLGNPRARSRRWVIGSIAPLPGALESGPVQRFALRTIEAALRLTIYAVYAELCLTLAETTQQAVPRHLADCC